MTSFLSDSIKEFLSEGFEITARVNAVLSSLGEGALNQDQLDALYRDMHTLKGSAQLFGFKQLALLAHAAEACLEPVRQGRLKLDDELIDEIFKAIDLIEQILKNPEKDSELNTDLMRELNRLVPQLAELTAEKLAGVNWALAKDHIAEEPLPEKTKDDVVSPNLNKEEIIEPRRPTEEAKEVSKTEKAPTAVEPTENTSIRVQVSLLDRLMNLVGELVLVRNQVTQNAKSSEDGAYIQLTQRLDVVTSELQDQAMRTRMQPVGLVFSKFQRTVRDITRDLGKKIDLKINGAETELDKSIIEAIKDPLTHIVRNSCDHGIEKPEERRKEGKNETGNLTLNAYQEGGQVVIEISDDGQGIDPERVRSKDLQKGLLTGAQLAAMSEQQIQELIFMAGFSTAEAVTSVSGRGVGMDVVRTNIEQVGGVIDLHSRKGRGTVLRLRIPLTLAIVPAMIVEANALSYAIPQIKLQELILIDCEGDRQQVEELQGQYFYRLRGELLPLIDLTHVLKLKPTRRPLSGTLNVAVVRSDNALYGLLIDQVSDTADIVVKPLSNFLKHLQVFSGATILGNGEVSLILDIQGFADYARAFKSKDVISSQQLNIGESTKKVINADLGEYLIVKTSSPETYAVPLSLVHRLEEFEAEKIQNSGQDYVVPYREGLLPVIPLEKFLQNNKEAFKFSGRVPVFVCTKQGRYYGFAVRDISDILSLESDVNSLLVQQTGIVGTLLGTDNQVRTVIDILAILDHLSGTQDSSGDKVAIKYRFSKQYRVLYVEDTPFFYKQVKRFLEEAGLAVEHAGNGDEALKLLESKGSQHGYDAILSDIEMPIMDGFTLAQKLKENEYTLKTPLVALTTRFREVDRERGQQVGFDYYLEKLKRDELVTTLKTIWGEK